MSLNIVNILTLADFIEKLPPHQFSISQWIDEDHADLPISQARHECGTCACIGGWADLLFSEDESVDVFSSGDAAYKLGLEEGEGSKLFMPPGFYTTPNVYTQAEVCWTLRNLAETGEVEWRV